MATSYKTPGVYIDEIAKFPPSVAEVETAIPVFVGYTETAERLSEGDLTGKPFRIKSFLEYQQYFGDPQYQAINVTVGSNGEPTKAEANNPSKYLMHYSVRSFYDNGGGPCYIFSVGGYPQKPEDKPDIKLYGDKEADSALNQIKKIDEITLIVFPDLSLFPPEVYYGIYQKCLMQCGNLKDRFTILDVLPSYVGSKRENGIDLQASIDALRESIGTSELKYGAAYFPYLKTNYNYSYKNASIRFIHKVKDKAKDEPAILDNAEYDDIMLFLNTNEASTTIENALANITPENKDDRRALIEKTWEALRFDILDESEATVKAVQDAINEILPEVTAGTVSGATKTKVTTGFSEYLKKQNDELKKANDVLKAGTQKKNYEELSKVVSADFKSKVDTACNKLYVEIPPSASMAGVYAYVDRTRGVWKAPANVTVQSVIEPVFKVSDAEQTDLNVSTTGKSVNVIRTFTGRGVQVWGARTLAGNDNEWRYISVRRFFNMVEESVKKATEPFVFEPNDANTWVKVKGMIENFLILQWRAGALAGAKPEHAFYVAVGLNQTMTALDILEGRMIVEIGMAAVRPAEFIILRFAHKMQES